MRLNHKPRTGDGTAWLVADRIKGDYLCYWYTGVCDGHLCDHGRVPTAVEAVAWGRRRTPRVRIHTADTYTYWAGTASRPEEFTHTWIVPDPAVAGTLGGASC